MKNYVDQNQHIGISVYIVFFYLKKMFFLRGPPASFFFKRGPPALLSIKYNKIIIYSPTGKKSYIVYFFKDFYRKLQSSKRVLKCTSIENAST